MGRDSLDIDTLRVNTDGSVDVYFAPETPEGFEANWIPTGEDWFTLFRFYGPEPALFDKSFVLLDIEKVK